MKILYLCDKDQYIKKMSRVRFHGMEAIEKITDFKWSGPNWENYNNDKPVQDNIDNTYGSEQPDLVVAYKPLDMKEFSKTRVPRCIRYNEMYDIDSTIKEIMQSRSNLVICHHENDCKQYKKLFNNFNLFPLKFYHVAHCAEKTVYKPYEVENKLDLLLIGAINIFTKFGQHYPLRDRMVKIIKKIENSTNYNCKIHAHPGYNHGDASTNKYAIGFAKIICSAKICITCSGVPRSRFGKYVEVPMCGIAIAADLPDEDRESFSKFLIEIDMDMADEEIIKKLCYYLKNEEERKALIQEGLKFSEQYTQEKYAERFVKAVKEFLGETFCNQ